MIAGAPKRNGSAVQQCYFIYIQYVNIYIQESGFGLLYVKFLPLCKVFTEIREKITKNLTFYIKHTKTLHRGKM